MPPVFVFLVICGAVAVWFLLSGIFQPLGRFLGRIWDRTYSEMTKEDETKNEDKRKIDNEEQ